VGTQIALSSAHRESAVGATALTLILTYNY
jgi:hypothetical protein